MWGNLPSGFEEIGYLLLAAVLGGLIGLERELHNQPAGLRTHMIVSLGSALITLVSIEFSRNRGGVDPSRIASNVVVGIGFLGAGTIMRFGTSVRGLTTAACLWTAAGIGMATGMGFLLGAVATTIILLVVVFTFDIIEKNYIVGKTYKRFIITAKDAPGAIGKIEANLEKLEIAVKSVAIHRDLVEKKVQLVIIAKAPEKLDADALTKEISKFEGVEKLDIE